MSLGYEQITAKIPETRDMRTESLAEMIARQSPEMRKQIKDRAVQLRAELATLPEIRGRQKIAQVELAAELGIGQESVSRIERRNDALVSTIRKAVEAMGGDLHIIAEFPRTAAAWSFQASERPDRLMRAALGISSQVRPR